MSFALRRRTPRDELAVRGALGELVAFGALVGALPALLMLAPSLDRHHIAGVPVADWLVIGPLFPLFVAIGWLYQRRADALDDAFRDLVRDE